jgi:hypothetical protein
MGVSPRYVQFATGWDAIDYYNGEFKLAYWFAVPLLVAIGVIPWFHWQYSLRTLLITMTMIAVGLGAIVYSMR